MPTVPVYSTAVGLAKDTTNAQLGANVAAAATSLPLVTVPGGLGATFSAILWDGVNTEIVALTGVASGSTVPVAALTNAHSAGCYVSFQLTASIGPTDTIPVTSWDDEDVYAQLEDLGIRGSAVQVWDKVQGQGNGQITIGGDVFPDTVGYLLAGLLGSTDFTSGAGTGPNIHAFSVKNSGDSQGTPFVFYAKDSLKTVGYAGAKIEELDFTFDPSGLVSYSAKVQAYASGIVPTFTPAPSALKPLAAYRGQLTVGGTLTLPLLSGTWSLKRPVTVDDTIVGYQGPDELFQTGLSASGTLKFLYKDDVQRLNHFLQDDQPSIDITYLIGAGTTQVGLQLHATKGNYDSAKLVRDLGKGRMELDVGFSAMASVSDATTAGGGASAGKYTIKNLKSTGSYT